MKALSILSDENFNVNKTQSGLSLLEEAYLSRNTNVFNEILNHTSMDLNEATMKKIIINVVTRASVDNNITVLEALKSKGVFKKGYLPSELRKLISGKI